MGISLLLCGERNNHRMAPRDLPWSLGNKLQQERQPMASTSHQVSRHWQHSPLASCKGSVWAWKTILMLTKTSPLCPPYKETEYNKSRMHPETYPYILIHEIMRNWGPRAPLTLYLQLQLASHMSFDYM